VSLPGTRIAADDLYDTAVSWPTRRVDEVRGRIMRFVTDEVTTPDGHTMVREYLEHPGGVSVIALDDDDNVAVVTQYRHPVGFRAVEPPAGLLDVSGEGYLLAAQRELAEEAELAGSDWRILADVFSSPGGSSESLRVYLARGLKRVPRPDGFELGGEEAHMDLHWARLSDLVDGIFAGRLQNPTLIIGVLALHTAMRDGRMDELRATSVPWPARDVLARR
jgi:ADP-ribose pyrophosphatase